MPPSPSPSLPTAPEPSTGLPRSATRCRPAFPWPPSDCTGTPANWPSTSSACSTVSHAGNKLEATQRTAVESACRAGDQALEGHARRSLAQAYAQTGRYGKALAELQRARGLFESLADHCGLSLSDRNLAIVYEALGRIRDAMLHAASALRYARLTADPMLEANGLNAVGFLNAKYGDPEVGLAQVLAALPLSRRHAPRVEPYVLDTLGLAYIRLGRLPDAINSFKRCIALRHTFHERRGLATTLLNLGDAYETAGNRTAARRSWHRALNLLNELQHPHTELARNRLRDHPSRAANTTNLLPHGRSTDIG
jgi:tetratricopeptide (TPR) repeat protein